MSESFGETQCIVSSEQGNPKGGEKGFPRGDLTGDPQGHPHETPQETPSETPEEASPEDQKVWEGDRGSFAQEGMVQGRPGRGGWGGGGGDILQFFFFFHFWCIPMILTQLPQGKNCWSFFKKHHGHEEVQLLDKPRRFFSGLHLAVGRHHRRRTPRCPHGLQLSRVKIFLADYVHARSRIYHKRLCC